MSKTVHLLLLAMVAVLLLAACRGPVAETPTAAPQPAATDTSEPVTEPEGPSSGAYPPPATFTYPAPGEEAYPPPMPTIDPSLLGPPFSIDEPLLAGAKSVSGTGPAGVPLQVVDITTVGETLGVGVVAGDGTFTVDLGTELVAGHSVGLQIGDLDGTPFDYEDFRRGPGYRDIPWIGVVFAQSTVRQP